MFWHIANRISGFIHSSDPLGFSANLLTVRADEISFWFARSISSNFREQER